MEKISVRRPFTVLVAVLIVIILGFVSVSNMTTDLLPSMSLPYMIVVTPYPGASPERVETAVSEPMERALGTKRFLLFYFICGFGAAALHMGVQYLQVHHWLAQGEMNNYYNLIRTPMLGASGAIYGILIGFALLNPDAVLVLLFPPIPLKAKWWVIIFAVIELLTGITGSRVGIAHFAHLGGMLFGFLLMWLWKKQGKIWW